MTKIPKAESKTIEFKTAFNQGGIKRIVDACKTHGYVDAEFMDLGSWFRVVLRKTGDGNFVRSRETPQKSALKSALKSTLKILEILAADPTCTYDELAEKFGVSRSAIKKQIRNLRNAGRLRRVGPDKGGHWEVLEGVS